MNAILTTYRGPTATHGPRIYAYEASTGTRCYVGRRYADDAARDHLRAALEMARRLRVTCPLVGAPIDGSATRWAWVRTAGQMRADPGASYAENERANVHAAGPAHTAPHGRSIGDLRK